MFDEEYVEWENATQKCQELGARLPVLSDAETIEIVKKYLDEAEFEVFEVKASTFILAWGTFLSYLITFRIEGNLKCVIFQQ